ncbi:DMT family transporter [Oceanicoccus sagamiensis]|uniref:EamA domain-containing protein n=1 Tax=Oceanicoccus sagamiensis TaxID=716816 RepID=A0A1X9N8H4_9GAMM|nr:DMT family transporter [Oceanicoccus sagamiensis]ARN74368.1 hypothetical protein BST96_09680 [Oceanicoccus sagamiensis]
MTLSNAIALMVLGAIWGSSFLFMKVAAPEFGPVPLIGIRVGLAALVLWLFFYWKKSAGEKLQFNGQMFIVGVLNSALPFSLFAYATLHLTAGVTSVINATVSIFAAIAGYLWLKESLSFARVAGLFIGFLGVCLLVDSIGAWQDKTVLLAVMAGLIASVSYVASSCYIKQRLQGMDPLSLTTSSMVCAAIAMLPLTVIYWPAQMPSAQSWLYALALAVLCTGVAFVIYYRLITEVGVSKTATVTLIVPMFGVSWGVVLLGEALTLKTGAACLAILAGTVLSANLLPLLTGRGERSGRYP